MRRDFSLMMMSDVRWVPARAIQQFRDIGPTSSFRSTSVSTKRYSDGRFSYYLLHSERPPMRLRVFLTLAVIVFVCAIIPVVSSQTPSLPQQAPPPPTAVASPSPATETV